jgi:nucleotide-binding universal stress UspA family protein
MNAQDTRRPVVVGVDGSPDAMRAVRWAAAEATRRKAPLRLVHAFAWTTDPDIAHPAITDPDWRALHEQATGFVSAAAAAAQEEFAGLTTEQKIVEGFPRAVLGAQARQAQAVVVGDRGRSRIQGMLVGSVTAALAAHADSPVVVVRGTERDDAATASLPVVVGVDGSHTSEAAIAFAYEAAAIRGVSLVAVHTWLDTVSTPEMAALIDWDALQSAEGELLSAQLDGWAAKYPDVELRRVVERDSPTHVLLREAQHAQLVVVGSRGRGDFAGLFLGSVSNALVHRAPCPVAVVRSDTTHRADR